MLNWLHACYGVGAATGPAIMTAIFAADLSWRWGYVAVGIAQVALAAAFTRSRHSWPRDSRQRGETGIESAPLYETLRLGRAQVALLLFLTYTGLELAVGTWGFTLLTEGRGVPVMMAGSWAALYWVALTAGRLASATVGSRMEARTVVRVGVTVLALGLGLLASGASWLSDLAGLLLAGFAAGPIFPTLIGATPARLSARHAANAVGLQIGSAAVGQALLPSALGVLGDEAGLQALSTALVVIAVAVIVINEAADGAVAVAAPRDSAMSQDG
jgi:fucose permease